MAFGTNRVGDAQTAAAPPHALSPSQKIQRLRDEGQYDEAISYANKMLLQIETGSRSYADTTYQLARAYEERHNYDESKKHLIYALDLYGKLNDQLGVAKVKAGLGTLCQDLEQYRDCEQYFNSAISIYESIAPNGPGMSAALVGKADGDIGQFLFGAAEKELLRALGIDRSFWGPEDPEVAKTLFELAQLYAKVGRFREAKDTLTRASDIDKKAYGTEEHFQVSQDISAMADLCLDMADFACASERAEKALSIDRKLFGDDDPSLADDMEEMALIASRRGEYAESERLYRKALSIVSAYFGSNSEDAGLVMYRLAEFLVLKGQYSTALSLYNRARNIDIRLYGVRDPETGEDDLEIGTAYKDLGNYPLAIQWIQEAIDIDTHAYGRDSSDAAADEEQLASVYSFKQDYDAALKHALHAAATFARVFGNDSPQYADSLSTTSSYFVRPEDFTRAIAMGEQSLQIYRHIYGERHPSTLARMRNVAQLYSQASQFEKAEEVAQAALDRDVEIWGTTHASVAADYEQLGLIARARQNFSDATADYQRALDIRQQVFGETSWFVSRTLYFLGFLKYEAADYTGAIKMLNSAITIEKANGDRPFLGSVYNALGLMYVARNDLHEGEISFRKALAILRKSLSYRNAASLGPLCNLALIYRIRYEDQKALPLYNEALSVARLVSPTSRLTVFPMLGLASLLLNQGDVAGAKRMLLKITRLYGSNEKTVEYAAATGLLGFLYQRARNYSEAAKYYQETLEVRSQALGPYHPSVASAYDNFASLYAEEGKYGEAVASERQNIEILERSIDSLLSMGSEEAKLKYVSLLSRQTWATVSRFIGISTPDAAQLVVETILRRKARALDATAEMLGTTPGGPPGTEDLNAQLRDERTKLASLIFNGSANLNKGAVLQTETAITQKMGADKVGSRTQNHDGSGRGLGRDSNVLLNLRSNDSPAYRAKVSETINKIQMLESKLSDLKGTINTEAATLSLVERALPVDSALIEYFVFRPYDPRSLHAHYYGRERLGGYALTRDSAPIIRDLGWLDNITEEVLNLRRAIANHNKLTTQRAGRDLFKGLVNPFAAVLEGKERLFISPDGPLGVVPFAALTMPDSNYMIQKFRISYFTAARDLLVKDSEHERMTLTAPVIVANPAFSVSVVNGPVSSAISDTPGPDHRSVSSKLGYFDQLDRTEDEGRAVCKLLQCDDHLLMGTRATKDAVLRLHSPAILHIATHGFFLSPKRNPSLLFTIGADGAEASLYGVPQANPMLDSGLALAGVNVPGERAAGILTALELSTVDLSGTQLVVLSACETGFGTDFTGEGVLGLRRAMRLAGAQRQVTSLWKVKDRVTARLMTNFYSHFLDDRSHVDALREAQLEILSVPTTSDPYYWAAFVADGTWKTVEPNLLLKAGDHRPSAH
jgi:CHAT domain-containing protein/tetratricopeptide (TPR) repeat protein